jgi:hypothetical protein
MDIVLRSGAIAGLQPSPTRALRSVLSPLLLGCLLWAAGGGPAAAQTPRRNLAGCPAVPLITASPLSQSIFTGQSAGLAVVANGQPPLAYQWFRGARGDTSAPVAGATAPYFETPPLAATSTYWVRVSNPNGSAASAAATVTTLTTTLGAASFTLDAAKAVSGTLSDGGLTLSQTDAAAVRWSLTIPAQVGGGDTAITMTPLKSVHGSSPTHPLDWGVQLEPDGMQFAEPATLTVTVPASVTARLRFYHGSHAGAVLELMSAERAGSTYTLKLFHFSPVVTGMDPVIAGLCADAEAQLAAATSEARALLKRPRTAPLPPKLDQTCGGKGDLLELQTKALYLKAFNSPEEAVMRKLAVASYEIELGGCRTDFALPPEWLALAERLAAKARDAIREARKTKDPDLFPALSHAALRAEHVCQLLGSYETGVLTDLRDWAGELRTIYLKRIREEHDLKVVPPFLTTARDHALLGGDESTLLDDLKNAMTFSASVRIVTTIDVPESGGKARGLQHTTVQAAAARLEPVTSEGNRNLWAGEATLEFSGGDQLNSCSFDHEPFLYCTSNVLPGSLVLGGVFDQAWLHLYQCDPSPRLTLKIPPMQAFDHESWDACQFGLNQAGHCTLEARAVQQWPVSGQTVEVFVIQAPDPRVSIEVPTQAEIDVGAKRKLTFSLPIENKKVDLVDTTIGLWAPIRGGEGRVSFDVTVTHTPQ